MYTSTTRPLSKPASIRKIHAVLCCSVSSTATTMGTSSRVPLTKQNLLPYKMKPFFFPCPPKALLVQYPYGFALNLPAWNILLDRILRESIQQLLHAFLFFKAATLSGFRGHGLPATPPSDEYGSHKEISPFATLLYFCLLPCDFFFFASSFYIRKAVIVSSAVTIRRFSSTVPLRLPTY